MRGGPEPGCSPRHAGHSSGHHTPCWRLWALPDYILPHQGLGVGASVMSPPAHLSSLPSVWHKHRTLGSQLSKKGQKQELEGHETRSPRP